MNRRAFLKTAGGSALSLTLRGEPAQRLPTPEGRMVRGRRYKYCIYSEGRRRESLADLEMDPGEAMNSGRQ